MNPLSRKPDIPFSAQDLTPLPRVVASRRLGKRSEGLGLHKVYTKVKKEKKRILVGSGSTS